jgi:hypothetical protein
MTKPKPKLMTKAGQLSTNVIEKLKKLEKKGQSGTRKGKMGGGMMKKPMMKKGGMAKLNPGLKAYLMKKKKKK